MYLLQEDGYVAHQIFYIINYNVFPMKRYHVDSGIVFRLLILHSSDWISNPSDDIPNGKEYFNKRETPGHRGHSEIITKWW